MTTLEILQKAKALSRNNILSLEQKNEASHRGKALRLFKEELIKYI